MSAAELKPLNWIADPDIGYSVERRPDGGLNVMFTSISKKTAEHWRVFALEHLFDSDRLTRNLYDLRAIEYIPPEAVTYALEVINDPSVRNIRLAVLASTEQVGQAVHEIAALSTGYGVELAVFKDVESAEAWLARPLSLLV